MKILNYLYLSYCHNYLLRQTTLAFPVPNEKAKKGCWMALCITHISNTTDQNKESISYLLNPFQRS